MARVAPRQAPLGRMGMSTHSQKFSIKQSIADITRTDSRDRTPGRKSNLATKIKMLIAPSNGHPPSPSPSPCSSPRSLCSSPDSSSFARPRSRRESPPLPPSRPLASNPRRPQLSHPPRRPHLPQMPSRRSVTSARWETARFPTTCRLVPTVSTTCTLSRVSRLPHAHLLHSGIFISVSRRQPALWNARGCASYGPSSASDTRCSRPR